MLGNVLEQGLMSVPAAQVTDIFLGLVGLVFIVTLLQALRGRHSQFLEYAPTMMTSLGILGTFMGVVIGLLNFDTTQIDQSIPLLLDGLKTAFITSVVGMAAALLFNTLDAWLFAPRRAAAGADVQVDVTPAMIYSVLDEQNRHLQELIRTLGGDAESSLITQMRLLRGDFSDFTRESRTQGAELLNCLGGDSESSLNTQLRLLRTQLTDFTSSTRSHQAEFSQELWRKLDNFSDMLSKSATSQIVEALSQVIREFNEQLTEQFGENFKRLDDSVQKLVVWQDQYKGQVETMSDQYQQSVASLVETRQAVGGIWQECRSIPEAMADLKVVMEVNQHQIQELDRHLGAFVQMREQAVQSVPTLQQKVEEVADQMYSGAMALQARLDEAGQQLLDYSEQTQGAFEQMSQQVGQAGSTLEQNSHALREHHKEVSNSLRETTGKAIEHIDQVGQEAQSHLATNLERIQGEWVSSLNQARAQLDGHLKGAAEALGDDVNAKLKLFEEGTLRELEKELETLGKALTSITRRFVTDYEQMVAKMDQVVKHQLRGY